MWYGAYILDVYCDDRNDYHHQLSHSKYVGETLGQTRKEARQDGWIFHKDGKMTCPTCSRKRKKRCQDGVSART